MARFRGTVQCGGGEASRLGSEKSGLVVEANGWNLGVRVRAWVDDEGNDVFDVYETKGSNNHSSKLVMTIQGGDNE